MLKRFLLWLVKNIFILLLVAFIFSAVAFDVPQMIKGLFSDIFQHASPDAQKDVVQKLTLACSSLGGKDISGLQHASPVPIDLSKLGSFCRDYNSGKMNDREFFFNVIGSAIPDKLDTPKSGILGKYSSIMDFLNKNKVFYIIVLLAILALLYLLAGNLSAFLSILSGISLSMGILILLPYAAVMAYEKFVGFDTTPILSSVLQGSLSFDPKAIASVVLLMILRTYTSFIVTLGAVFLGAGIAGKIYIKRMNKNPKAMPDKKSEKEAKEEKTKKEKPKEKQTKEEIEEDYRHRDRSTKEILDELDDIHKKKSNKKE